MRTARHRLDHEESVRASYRPGAGRSVAADGGTVGRGRWERSRGTSDCLRTSAGRWSLRDPRDEPVDCCEAEVDRVLAAHCCLLARAAEIAGASASAKVTSAGWWGGHGNRGDRSLSAIAASSMGVRDHRSDGSRDAAELHHEGHTFAVVIERTQDRATGRALRGSRHEITRICTATPCALREARDGHVRDRETRAGLGAVGLPGPDRLT